MNNGKQPSTPTVALLPFGYLFDELLDKIQVSLESFCTQMTGGWLFGYVDALRRAGVRPVLVCFAGRTQRPTCYRHQPSGITAWVLPVPPMYLVLRRRLPNPYGRTMRQSFGKLGSPRALLYPWLWLLKETAPYLATPVEPLTEVLRREHCDAILCQEYEFSRFDACVRLGARLKLPVFATFQGGDYQRGRLERFVRPGSMRASSGLIIATKAESERVQRSYGVPPAKCGRIFNPLDLKQFEHADPKAARAALGIPSRARVAVWHGRVSIQQKGLDLLLEAWRLVCRERKEQDLRLLLLGAGQDSARLRQQIDAMQLHNIHWRDEYVLDRTVVREYLSAGDVYVFPSRHEGFPVAPMEAMACGLPVVAAAANGVPDILEDAENSGGIMVPCEDVGRFAAGLGTLLDDEDLRTTLGERARKRAQSCFSLEAVGQQLRQFLFHSNS